MLFRRHQPEYSDGIIDLIPQHITPQDKELGFGQEQAWRITMHGKREEIGRICFRAGESRGLYYYGHIGYHIDEPWRGHHYAVRACRLIRPEIRMSGKRSVVITCDQGNLPSRRTCELLGCRFEQSVKVPEDLRKKYDLEATKRRYIWVPEENDDRNN